MYKVVWYLSIGLIPLLFVVFGIVRLIDRSLYMRMAGEDNILERGTFALLLLAGVLALRIALRLRRSAGRGFWFFTLFFVMCMLGAMEEISWGQRILGIESPEFFLEHSDQREINTHNVLQKWSGLMLKYVVGVVLFLYGACLPQLARIGWVKAFCDRVGLVVPPRVLSLGICLAALMMLDWPTGYEEEIGELCFSLCFVFFMLLHGSGDGGTPSGVALPADG
jgi:hypothetical protein